MESADTFGAMAISMMAAGPMGSRMVTGAFIRRARERLMSVSGILDISMSKMRSLKSSVAMESSSQKNKSFMIVSSTSG